MLVLTGMEKPCDLAIWFVNTPEELEAQIGEFAANLHGAPLWITWKKKIPGIVSRLSQQEVRAAGMANGLVDYKIASIDETWSGLLFTRAKTL